MRRTALLALLLAACQPAPIKPPAAPPKPEPPNAAGLVSLPCDGKGPLQPVTKGYCLGHRHFVTPAVRASLVAAATAVAAKYPGAVVRYMEASWPSGKKPMPPHLSHGDGREVDLAVFYEIPDGKDLANAPTRSGYGGYEPPRSERERVCVGMKGHHANPDPPASRGWRLDAARTTELTRRLAADKRVRRIFLEPHLKARLGFGREAKIRFAGCHAARHDDHLHVDFL